MEEYQRNFKGIWVPKEVWLSKELSILEKILLVEIDSLDNEEGCFASNKYFSNFFGITTGSVSQLISSLKEKNFIDIDYEKKGKQIIKRIIKLKKPPYPEVFNKLNRGYLENYIGGIKKIKEGYLENYKDNNIIYNNINNNINIYCREVIDYLNLKTKKHFKYTQNNINKIKTRLNEGFTIEECKIVIDKKTDEWLNNENMNKYLRPETLFGNKFESYLNQNKINSNIPEWFNKEIQKEKPTEKEQEELENIINELI